MSLTTAPINRRPQGLLSLLDIQSMGMVPDRLAAQVMTTVDMTPFYVLQSERHYYLNVAGGQLAVGAFIGSFIPWTLSGPDPLPLNAAGNIAVPQDENWLVSYFHTFIGFNGVAGDVGDLIPAVQRNSLDLFPLAISTMAGIPSSVAGRARRCRWFAVTPLWLAPGTELGMTLNDWLVANPTTVGGRLTLTRLRGA